MARHRGLAVAKKYKSGILRSVHRAASDLAEIGILNKRTVRKLDRMCLTVSLSPGIRTIGKRASDPGRTPRRGA
jgi:hypothetical protein